jgi:hypothetical protein
MRVEGKNQTLIHVSSGSVQRSLLFVGQEVGCTIITGLQAGLILSQLSFMYLFRQEEDKSIHYARSADRGVVRVQRKSSFSLVPLLIPVSIAT